LRREKGRTAMMKFIISQEERKTMILIMT